MEVVNIDKRRKVEDLISRIKYIASKHGYVPSKVLIAIFEKG